MRRADVLRILSSMALPAKSVPIYERNKNMRIYLASSLAWFLIATLLSFPGIAAADSSCVNPLAKKWASLAADESYGIEITMHRETKYVSFSDGWLTAAPNGGFTGKSNQLFSDRLAGSQPFNINAADNLDLKLSSTGMLSIHYRPWNFDTSWDLSCKGSLLTAYVPTIGVITLTFRDKRPPLR